MMKRRNCLICSIIAMLSIVSYACETEYAICEGCGGTGGTGNGQTPTCNDDAQRCSPNLESNESCKDGEWKRGKKCTYCFNENEDNSETNSLVCEECTPNSYNESGTKVCYKGAFKKFESKSDSDSNLGVVINTEPESDDAPWEFAYNNSGSLKYYNCHNDRALNSMQPDFGGGQSVKIESCCKENDYYIKRVGYKYYSVEVCRKVVFGEGTRTDFWAYEYTDELNDSLIGKEDDLPYSFCHGGSIWAVNKNNDFSQASSMMYQKRMCPKGYSCAFNGICLSDSFKTTDLSGDDKFFVCEQAAGSQKGISIKYEHGNDSVGTCLSNMVLKQNIDGKWMDVTCNPNQKFKISEVRCAPSR